MSKHDLRARPVFHHTRDAIEAHLTVVMAALAVARHIQETTGISIKRIIRTLKPLQDVTINLNGITSLPNPKSPQPQPASSNPYSPQGTKVSRVRSHLGLLLLMERKCRAPAFCAPLRMRLHH